MENLFVSLKSKKHTQGKYFLDEESKEILRFLEDTKMRLEYAELCLNSTNDDLLIDSIIYETMSLQKKYDYFLKLIKQKPIVVNSPILQKFPAS